MNTFKVTWLVAVCSVMSPLCLQAQDRRRLEGVQHLKYQVSVARRQLLIGEPLWIQIIHGNPTSDALIEWQGEVVLDLDHRLLTIEYVFEGRIGELLIPRGNDICRQQRAMYPSLPGPDEVHRAGKGTLGPGRVIRQWVAVSPREAPYVFRQAGIYTLQLVFRDLGVIAKYEVDLVAPSHVNLAKEIEDLWSKSGDEITTPFSSVTAHKKDKYEQALRRAQSIVRQIGDVPARKTFQYFEHSLKYGFTRSIADWEAIAKLARDKTFPMQRSAYLFLTSKGESQYTPEERKHLWDWTTMYPDRLQD